VCVCVCVCVCVHLHTYIHTHTHFDEAFKGLKARVDDDVQVSLCVSNVCLMCCQYLDEAFEGLKGRVANDVRVALDGHGRYNSHVPHILLVQNEGE
jgi:hypothetical protein